MEGIYKGQEYTRRVISAAEQKQMAYIRHHVHRAHHSETYSTRHRGTRRGRCIHGHTFSASATRVENLMVCAALTQATKPSHSPRTPNGSLRTV